MMAGTPDRPKVLGLDRFEVDGPSRSGLGAPEEREHTGPAGASRVS
jgi:hypothetical protein